MSSIAGTVWQWLNSELRLAASDPAAALREFWATFGPGGKLHPKEFLEHRYHYIVEACLVLGIAYLVSQRRGPAKPAPEQLTDAVRSATPPRASGGAAAAATARPALHARGATALCHRAAACKMHASHARRMVSACPSQMRPFPHGRQGLDAVLCKSLVLVLRRRGCQELSDDDGVRASHQSCRAGN